MLDTSRINDIIVTGAPARFAAAASYGAGYLCWPTGKTATGDVFITLDESAPAGIVQRASRANLFECEGEIPAPVVAPDPAIERAVDQAIEVPEVVVVFLKNGGPHDRGQPTRLIGRAAQRVLYVPIQQAPYAGGGYVWQFDIGGRDVFSATFDQLRLGRDPHPGAKALPPRAEATAVAPRTVALREEVREAMASGDDCFAWYSDPGRPTVRFVPILALGQWVLGCMGSSRHGGLRSVVTAFPAVAVERAVDPPNVRSGVMPDTRARVRWC